MKITVIIPTFNEKENIERIIDLLEEEFVKMPSHRFWILVVDGNSTDETPHLAAKKAAQYGNIYIINEKKRGGLGAAFSSGMIYAIDNFGSEALVEMDSDLQHDPRDLTKLVEKLNEGFDYVIGSRYIEGGTIPSEWAFHRKLLSWGANLFSRIVLLLFEMHDVTSGYRISRSTYIKKIDFSKLEKKAFAYKIQLLFEMKKAGAKLAEVPITFGLRDRGDSKMQRENITGTFLLVLKLRYQESESFIKFLIVGALGLLVQSVLFFSLVLMLSFDPAVAIFPSFLVAVLTTFTFNNIWSFKERQIIGSKEKFFKFLTFILINIGTFFIQKISIRFSQVVFNQAILPVLFIGYPVGITLGLVWNYFFYSKIVWRKK